MARSAYGDDLAYIHDVGYGEFAERAAPAILRLLAQAGVASGLVVDLGCGSGRWARWLVDAGYRVRGIDGSSAMIALARRRVPTGARFQVASFVSVRLPGCDALTALGEVLGYGAPELAPLLARAYDALRPGGLFVFDLAGPGRGQPAHGGSVGPDWAVVVEKAEHERILTRRITTFRRVGRIYRRGEELHRLRLHEPGEVLAALRRTGFRAHALRGYGSVRFAPGLCGFVARKP